MQCDPEIWDDPSAILILMAPNIYDIYGSVLEFLFQPNSSNFSWIRGLLIHDVIDFYVFYLLENDDSSIESFPMTRVLVHIGKKLEKTSWQSFSRSKTTLRQKINFTK